MIPSAALVGGSARFASSCRLLKELNWFSQGINEAFLGLDPIQHAAHVKLRETAESRYPHIAALNAIDPLLMQGRSIIANRFTDEHIDGLDPAQGWAVLGAFGPFQGGGSLRVPRLNTRTPFNSGDLIFIRGGALAHEVESWEDGQRFSIAHFTHKSVWRELGVELPL